MNLEGQQFTDPDFKPQLSSIYDENDTMLAEDQKKSYNTIVWKRASEIYENPVVFKTGGISPQDVV